jgi:hypothetical protein
MDARQFAMVVIIAVAGVAALVLWYSRRLALRRMMSAAIGVIAALAGYLTMVGYAIPALSDFNSPRVKLRTAVLGNLLIWIVCLASLVLAVRFLLYAVRPPTARSRESAK